MIEISLATLHGGVAMDLFNEELRKVMENIADPNATPDAVRTISIKVRIKPDKERRFATTTASSSSTLAPVSPTEGTMFFRSTDGGAWKLAARERIKAYLEQGCKGLRVL